MPTNVIRLITVRQMNRYAKLFNKSELKKTVIARYARGVLTQSEVEYLFGKHELKAA